MKRFSRRLPGGFTMIELMVVIAIISLMMVMAASVLRDPGKGRSMDSAIDMMESLVREARATAQGNDTYTRIIIANDPNSATARDSRHLRFMTVQMFKKSDAKGAGSDGTDVVHKGKWVSTSAGVMLPSGVYFSPHYSRPVEWMDGEDGLGQDSARLSNKGTTKVYCIEFDEKGRFAAPEKFEEGGPEGLVDLVEFFNKDRLHVFGYVTQYFQQFSACLFNIIMLPLKELISGVYPFEFFDSTDIRTSQRRYFPF